MEPRSTARPTSILVGAAVVALAALFLFGQTWDALGAIGSDATQSALRRALGSNSDVTLADLTSMIRVVHLAAAAAAVASVVFAAYAVTGRRDARIALVICAVVGGVGSLVVDPILAAAYVFGVYLVVGSVQARAWFAGRPAPGPATDGRRAAPPAGGSTTVEPAPSMHRHPTTGPVEEASTPVTMPPRSPAGPSPARSGARPPAALFAAARLAWIGATLGGLAAVVAAVSAVADQEAMIAWARAQFHFDPLTISALEVTAILIGAMALAGAVLVLVAILALITLRGSSTARVFSIMLLLAAAAGGFIAISEAHFSGLATLVVGVASIAMAASVLLLLAPSVSIHFGDRPGDNGTGGAPPQNPEYVEQPTRADVPAPGNQGTPAPGDAPADPEPGAPPPTSDDKPRLPPVW